MLKWILFFTIFSLLHWTEPWSRLQIFSAQLQAKCAAAAPASLHHRELVQSFVCGLPLKDKTSRELFQRSGLLHLMVVSGSHLQMVALLWILLWPQKGKWQVLRRWLLWLSLLFYCLVTGLQAPVVRSFFSLIVAHLSSAFHWHWDHGKIQLATGILLLSLQPQWIFNFSFYLSWLASLGFLLQPLLRVGSPGPLAKFLSYGFTCFAIQAILSVVFGQFQFLAVITNSALAPVLGIILFPLSFVALLLPMTAPWVDLGWSFLLMGLNWILQHWSVPTELTSPFPISALRWFLLWIFLAFLQCTFDLLRQIRYRKSNV